MRSLFEPTDINGMVLSNRFVRSATWEGLASDDGSCTLRLIELMAKLSRGGVGMIITGHTYVHPDGKHSVGQMGIHSDEMMPGLRAMADAVHEKNGRIVVQLGYGGAYLSKARVRRMSLQDFLEVAQAFGRAAIRARDAGCDGVQIFAAHGFFLSQMLSPRYNDRTDAYGGEIQNRARPLIEVLGAIRDSVGRKYPVLAKLNARDLVEGGLSLEDSIRVGTMLEAGGIDAIELSGGLLNLPNLMRERIERDEGGAYFEQEAQAFRERIKVPLILVGGIRSHQVAERLVREGTVDYVALCRPLIREPDLISRWQGGDLGRATCTSCNNCVEHIKKGDGPICEPLQPEVVETFFPALSEMVPASAPHPPGTCYLISIGLEQWESNFVPVVKVQMTHDGKVSECSPSFPLGSADHREVGRVIDDLLRRHAAQAKT